MFKLHVKNGQGDEKDHILHISSDAHVATPFQELAPSHLRVTIYILLLRRSWLPLPDEWGQTDVKNCGF